MLALSLMFLVAVVVTMSAVLGVGTPAAVVAVIALVGVISLVVCLRHRFAARRSLV